MILFSSPTCAYSQRVRIVLFEKGISADIEYFDRGQPPGDLLELNPSGSTPTMVDRDLVLSESRIIMEYLDERFPHPPLHPIDPVLRARARMLLYRIDQDWFQLLDAIDAAAGRDEREALIRRLRESLAAAVPLFAAKPYFLSDDFSLVDCAIAPMLWRLPSLGIQLPDLSDSVKFYAGRLFERDAFRASLTDQERAFPNSPNLTFRR